MNVGACIREWFGAGIEIPFRLEPRWQPLEALRSSDELPHFLIRLFEDALRAVFCADTIHCHIVPFDTSAPKRR